MMLVEMSKKQLFAMYAKHGGTKAVKSFNNRSELVDELRRMKVMEESPPPIQPLPEKDPLAIPAVLRAGTPENKKAREDGAKESETKRRIRETKPDPLAGLDDEPASAGSKPAPKPASGKPKREKIGSVNLNPQPVLNALVKAVKDLGGTMGWDRKARKWAIEKGTKRIELTGPELAAKRDGLEPEAFAKAVFK